MIKAIFIATAVIITVLYQAQEYIRSVAWQFIM